MPTLYLKFLRPLFLLIAFLMFAGSILGRVLYRGVYFPGWDIIGTAQGQYLLKTLGIGGALQQVFHDSRHFQYWVSISSLFYTLIPGSLNLVYQWELWGSLLNFILFLLILRIMFRVAQLDKNDLTFFLFSITSCSVFLSLSVVNYPYESGLLPHALALGLVTHSKLRARPLITLFLGCFIAEISMHCYDLGKTAVVVFVAFAIFDKKSDKKLRLAWFVSAGLFLFYILRYRVSFPTQPLFDYKNIFGILPVLKLTLTQAKYENPLIFILGLFSCFFVKKERIPIILNLLFQWFLIFVLFKSFGESTVRSRRLIVLEFYSLILLFCAWKDNTNKMFSKTQLTTLGKSISLLLFIGSSWQVINLYYFTRVDITKRNRSLPFTESTADHYVNPKLPNLLSSMQNHIAYGKKLILLYNYLSYSENTTDPNGLPERLYVRLGHEVFSDNVFIFSSLKKRYSQVPIHDSTKFEGFITNLKKEKSVRDIEVWKLSYEHSPHSKTEINSQMTLLLSHFNLRKCFKEIPDWECFELDSIKE